MKSIFAALIAASVLIASGMSQTHVHPKPDNQVHRNVSDAEDGKPGVVTGFVRDIACLLRNPNAQAATTPTTKECMEKCIKSGSPIGILSSDGTLYTPISRDIPDVSVRKQLLPYAGKYVRATGKIFERGSLHAIAISNIEIVDASEAH
jgi:hypothetical protein